MPAFDTRWSTRTLPILTTVGFLGGLLAVATRNAVVGSLGALTFVAAIPG